MMQGKLRLLGVAGFLVASFVGAAASAQQALEELYRVRMAAAGADPANWLDRFQLYSQVSF
jgi:hypothetical protein